MKVLGKTLENFENVPIEERNELEQLLQSDSDLFELY